MGGGREGNGFGHGRCILSSEDAFSMSRENHGYQDLGPVCPKLEAGLRRTTRDNDMVAS